ncbi:hypothetical protein [Variovorax paradoxus]|uniref:hypothetical protein n=1 Tax=Variovorax paradoxus TaxID=34073 RepID=UPI00285FE5C8|nr:hypothetical protein [Variovorax paradoxus]MDR6455483.1 hypothetical protein [Variovorax paradoxus]
MSNEPTIRDAFERALIDGLKPQPLVGKEGPVKDPVSGELLTGPPEASFLSVVRAYLKDLAGGGDGTKVPKTGQPRDGGILAEYMQTRGKGLPFGRPQ